jgi:hypothetical protein
MNEQASTKAVLSLVFGVLSFVACPIVGSILAIVLGSGERSGVGRAGAILGWISLALSLLGAAIYLFCLLVLGIALFSAN